MMPKMDGYTVNLKLKEDEKTKDIPVIIITGKGQTRELFKQKDKAKVDGFLEKPFTIDVLKNEIKRVLEGHHKKNA